MTDTHFINTLKLLERFAQKRRNKLACMACPFSLDTMAELDFERAQDEAIEGESDDIEYLPSETRKKFDALEKEALKRNLEW